MRINPNNPFAFSIKGKRVKRNYDRFFRLGFKQNWYWDILFSIGIGTSLMLIISGYQVVFYGAETVAYERYVRGAFIYSPKLQIILGIPVWYWLKKFYWEKRREHLQKSLPHMKQSGRNIEAYFLFEYNKPLLEILRQYLLDYYEECYYAGEIEGKGKETIIPFHD